MVDAYKSTKDKWRAFGYEKAIIALKVCLVMSFACSMFLYCNESGIWMSQSKTHLDVNETLIPCIFSEVQLVACGCVTRLVTLAHELLRHSHFDVALPLFTRPVPMTLVKSVYDGCSLLRILWTLTRRRWLYLMLARVLLRKSRRSLKVVVWRSWNYCNLVRTWQLCNSSWGYGVSALKLPINGPIRCVEMFGVLFLLSVWCRRALQLLTRHLWTPFYCLHKFETAGY